MTKRTRYTLILVCVAAFFVLAPFVVLYVRGVTYDRANNKYLSTGLLSVRTDPRDVQVYLNDALVETTPADIRFLKTGGYNVRLQKEGYRPWSKRIEVTAGKVSWVSPAVEKIILFFTEPEVAEIAQNVMDFKKLSSGGWLYLTSKSLELSSNNSGAAQRSFALPKPVNKVASSSNDRLFLLSSDKTALLFSAEAGTFKDISTVFKNVTSYSFDRGDNLWLLKNNQLIRLDTATSEQKAFANNVAAFYSLSDPVYYIQKTTETEGKLYVLPQTEGASATALADVPIAKRTELGVTNQKEIFVLADNSVYRVNEKSELLQAGVANWYFDGPARTLLLTTANELNFYNFLSNRIQLISRSASGFASPQLDSSLNYVFYGQNGQLVAAELDTFDHQNTYNLAELSVNAKFSLEKDDKRLYLLDTGRLTILNIR